MSIYQRYLSKSLMCFFILFVTFLLFIQSNLGFKWIFHFANRFFLELKVEKISGNWHDFSLTKIKYDILGISVKADSVHIKLDVQSLLNISTIFKEIETKNLILSFQKNASMNISKNNILDSLSKNKIFIKYPIIFQKIHIDKLLLQSDKVKLCFLNILTGVKFINNNVIILPTYIDNIHIKSPHDMLSKISFKKKNIIHKLHLIKKFNNTKKIYNFFNYTAKLYKIYIPLNINLKYLKCKKIKFFNYNDKNVNLFQLKLRAQIKENILRIKTIKINSSLFKIQSFGKIIFKHNVAISSLIYNEIIIPKFNNKSIKFVFKSHLNHKFIFTLESKYLYKFKIHGSIFLNHVDCPFFIKLHSENAFWSIKKKYFLNFISFNAYLKGKINNYFISLKNIIYTKGLPSIVFNIKGKGNFQNISLTKITLFPINNIKDHKKIISIVDNIKYNKYILQLMGKINIFSNINNNIKNLYIPNIHLNIQFMKKKLSILGSLYHHNNILNIPRMNLLIGKNKLFLKGFLGKKYNLYSSIYANNLNYFFSGLKGGIQAQLKLHGNDVSPILSSNVVVKNLLTNSTNIKNLKIFTNINIRDLSLGNILLDVKNICFYNFCINKLHIKSNLNNYQQKFNILLKSKKFYINFKFNRIFNKKTRVWNDLFKITHTKTFWGNLRFAKNFSIHYFDYNHLINNSYKKHIKIKKFLSFLIYNKKLSFLNFFNKSLINFKSNLFIQAQLKGFLGNRVSNGKIFLTGYHIQLEKNQNKKIFLEKIDYLKVSINLLKNNLKSQWIVKKLDKSSKDKIIFGNLNITHLYNTKDINGKFYIVNFPISFFNFFTTNVNEIKGILKIQIKFFGNVYQPKILADINFQDIFFRSNTLLQYITILFPYLPKKINNIKINQEIMIKKGNVSFQLNTCLNNFHNLEWYLIFHSDKISVLVLPKIKLQFSSDLNLHYLLSKYDLMGFIKLPFFCFTINKKNVLF